MPDHSSDEMMTVSTTPALSDVAPASSGSGAQRGGDLARATHAPGWSDLRVGHDRGRPDRLPLSIGDGILAETADAVVSVP